jgi:hypothetical protein
MLVSGQRRIRGTSDPKADLCSPFSIALPASWSRRLLRERAMHTPSSPVVVGFPLRGEWVAVRTPVHGIPDHGTDLLGQRDAFDFVRPVASLAAANGSARCSKATLKLMVEDVVNDGGKRGARHSK